MPLTLERRGGCLWLSCLPVDAMGRLAALAPAGPQEREVLLALLTGTRVCVPRQALCYRQYRKSAPAGIYRRCVALERRLREMGVIVIRNGRGQSLGH